MRAADKNSRRRSCLRCFDDGVIKSIGYDFFELISPLEVNSIHYSQDAEFAGVKNPGVEESGEGMYGKSSLQYCVLSMA